MKRCRICANDAVLNAIGRESNGYELLQCSVCRVVLTATVGPGSRQLYDALFSDGEYEAHRRQFGALMAGKPAWGLYHAWMIRKIERRKLVGNLIEIGGGAGAFGFLARRRGWQYTDFDISSTAVDFARKLGLDAQLIGPEALPQLPPNSADVVVLWEVIEHIWDVAGYLRTISAALRRGGLLVMSTPNWDYMKRREVWGPLSSPPIHCNFFDERSLRRALGAHGFDPVTVEKKRVLRPEWNVAGVANSARQLFGLEPAGTLAVFARWLRAGADGRGQRSG